MYINEIEIDLFMTYEVANKDKRKKAIKHKDQVGKLKIEYPMDTEKMEKVVDTLLEAFEFDHILAEINITTCNG